MQAFMHAKNVCLNSRHPKYGAKRAWDKMPAILRAMAISGDMIRDQQVLIFSFSRMWTSTFTYVASGRYSKARISTKFKH